MSNGRVDSYNSAQQRAAAEAKDIAVRYAQLKLRHKMGNAKRQEIDGYKFASKAEARRYQDLKLMERAGTIYNLTPHPLFEIFVNKVRICNVVADFSYDKLIDENWVTVVEDVKSQRVGRDGKVKFSTDTRHSKIGRKLVLAVHGIEIHLVA